MPEYLHPGVYIEEIPSGPSPIEGVSTSTAGFVGVTLRGPTEGKPVLVTSFADFTRNFGGFYGEPDNATVQKWRSDPVNAGEWWLFAHSVRAFFDNGGQRLYVRRVLPATAVAASANFSAGFTAQVVGVEGTTVELDHVIGLEGGDSLRIFSGDSELTAAPQTFTDLNRETRKITLSAAVPRLARGAVVRAVRAEGPALIRITARDRGDGGNRLFVRLRPIHGASLSIMFGGDPNTAPFFTQVTAVESIPTTGNAPPESWLTLADIGALAANSRVRVGGKAATVLEVAGGRIRVAGGHWTTPATLVEARSATIAGGAGAAANQLLVKGASRLYVGALVELGPDPFLATRVTAVDATTGVVTFANPVPGQLEGNVLRTVEAAVEVVPDGVGGSQPLEAFGNLRLTDNAQRNDPLFIGRFVDRNSRLIRLGVLAEMPNTPTISDFPTTQLAGAVQTLRAQLGGGDDRIGDLKAGDFVGQDDGPEKRSGVLALEDIDEVSICAAPGMWSSVIHDALIVHCEGLKDRFAVLDVKNGLDIEGVRSARSPLSSQYAALYYPWLKTVDPQSGQVIDVPPSGHAVGIYARVDVARGVHKAPANEVIRGVTSAAVDITAREQDLLNPEGINAIRFFPGRGLRIWGARTLSDLGEWKYISVRRLFIFLEESIEEATQWVVFEPNDEPTWARVRQSITNFLNTQWRNGALQGKTADQAFFVKCDYTTMTQDDIDNGRLICIIGVAPVKPAEFVIFRFMQKTLEAKA